MNGIFNGYIKNREKSNEKYNRDDSNKNTFF